jgi:Plasmid pRiA4b ORF-3-like protein
MAKPRALRFGSRRLRIRGQRRSVGTVISEAGTVGEFEYAYDMGDDWRHRLMIEADGGAPARKFDRLPLCIAGENACLPAGRRRRLARLCAISGGERTKPSSSRVCSMRNTVVLGSCSSRTRSASVHAERVFMRRMRRSARCTLRMASLILAFRTERRRRKNPAPPALLRGRKGALA